ncbi:tetratricopeptide repeat protein [Marixanthomonas spongiae]|uniref:Tetratricopeptide repeat protein n=1 Tax=Marixanthomonas spongiae TaxID=2174845 RepID=A0A2U0I591_9FLAO|nr:hypothetical protein [Marixanthomonas spongiae]PVW16277.1 hypothetical protein DDV96_03135 [Marixanthomonas spongiae]
MDKEALIEAYFSNRISNVEFEQLQQLLKEDAALRERFYNELELKEAIAREEHSDLKNRFRSLEAKQKKRSFWYVYAAAAVVVLIAIGSLLYEEPPTTQTLYADYFEPYPNVVHLSSRSQLAEEDVAAGAFELYETGQYTKAATAFKALYQATSKDYLVFYQGVSLLASNQTHEGIEVLESYPWEVTQSDFAAPANWYLGLAYIKLENLAQATHYLNKVTQAKSPLSQTARNLLEQLD